MNFSNPTHTIPLNGLPSSRTSYRNSNNNHAKHNTHQFEQVLMKTNLIAENNVQEEKCLSANGKTSEEVLHLSVEDP